MKSQSMLTQQEYQVFLQKLELLSETFDTKSLEKELTILEKQTQNPNFWNNQEKAQKVNKQISILNKKLEKINSLKTTTENLQAAWELNDDEEIEKTLKTAKKIKEEVENDNYLTGKFDQHDAILSIHSGAGGIDAQDFAAILLSMYQNFCKNQDWKCEIIHISSGDEGGVKSATMKVEGENTYGLLKEEAGVHRLVRISPFNSGNTRETSFASVEILPADIDKEFEVQEIEEKDLKWDYFLASGNGGQSVNTTYSAVRVTHLPTNITVTCQNERSQQQNKLQALKYLKNKLALLEIEKQKDFIDDVKQISQSADFGSQIRNYVLHPYKLVKDTRSGHESNEPDKIFAGEQLLDFIWSVKKIKNA